MKINRMKKKEFPKDNKITDKINKPDYIISKQIMGQIMTQIQDNKSIKSISNHKFQQSSKNISDRQKYFIVQLQIHKKIMHKRLQALKKQINILQNIPNNQIPTQMLEKQEQITRKQQRAFYQKICSLQFVRTKDAQNQYQIAKAKYFHLKIQALKQGVILQKEKISQQLQKTQKLIQKQGKQTLILQQQSKEVYEQKKKQNNLLQQTKGNIRVYCRLRPAHNQRIQYQVTDNLIKLKRDKSELKSKNRVEEYEYLFQKIFGEDIPQNLVFQQLAQLVQCSVDGKNVCIFAYGQTGSGKTHTMTGSLDGHKQELRGFIPRSIQYIFDQVQIAKTNGYEANISVSICEVYNDKIFDLLSYSFQRGSSSDSKKNGSESKYSKPISASGSKKNLNQQKSTEDLVQFIVKTPQQALLAMSNALKRRTTAQTKMNTQSSRSHLIFEIRNEFYNPLTKVSRCSSLVLVDLAGSERQKDSGVTGIRLEEAKSINNSLTELGKVMRAIKDEQRPSFRNCKLTMILQKYLESDSKAVMFVNVSPDKKDLDQTVNSLVFAESVRQCKIKNNKNLKPTSTF